MARRFRVCLKSLARMTASAEWISPACVDVPVAVRDLFDAVDSGLELDCYALPLGEVGDGGEELAERSGGDAEAASLWGAQEGLVEDFASVFDGAAFEAVVEGSDDDGLPEVADGAVSLAGALEPGGEAFGVVGWVAAEESCEAGGDSGLVAQAEHGCAEEADGLVCGGWQRAGTQKGAATTWFEEGKLVVPADRIGHACFLAEIEDVGAAAEDDVLGVDGLFERGMVVGVGSAADVGPALKKSDLGTRSG